MKDEEIIKNDEGIAYTIPGEETAASDTSAASTATAKKNPSQWPVSGNLRNGATPPTVPSASYSSPYDQQLQDLYKSITERKPFEYNADDDAMYQQYKDRYMQLGQQAMHDTMGQAAALTGGYGSSYGQAVGQQQYDQYMLGLNDKASELYAQAYQRYQDEGDRQRQNYAMLGDLADRDYNLWSGEYNRQLNDYTLGLDEAAAMAQYGDFSGYAALYGQEAAQSMLASWAAQNPQLAFMQGAITEGQFQNLQAGRPMNEGLDEDGNPIGGMLGGGTDLVSYWEALQNTQTGMGEDVIAAQKELQKGGFYTGPIDGIWGAGTAQAAFEASGGQGSSLKDFLK